MILLSGFYHDPDPRRRGEMLECLKRNAANEWIDGVCVFIEDETPPELLAAELGDLRKVQFIKSGRRVTYRFLFDYANENFSGRTVAVANADIFFDESLARLSGYDLTRKMLCLSRWDVREDGSLEFFEHTASQDAWIFTAPLRQIYCDFHLGKPACDNRLAWEAEHAGLKVSNPARSIRACHLHLSAVRRYSEHERLRGRVKAVPAIALETSYPSERGTPPMIESATVAFHDRMGYTIKDLVAGASSHNNETRPFKHVPEQLRHLQFTQVVANSNSAFEVEFLSPGKLYVLVGNDWSGHEVAVQWLHRAGYREPISFIETTGDFGFEVWSLAGDQGERFMMPVQVMLAAKELVKRGPTEAVTRKAGIRRSRNDSIYALTSLPPKPRNAAATAECIKSWRAAGLNVVAFNHPSEIEVLSPIFDVEFVPVEKTAHDTFGGHYIYINTLLNWAAEQDALALLINADIRLQLEPWELKRIRWLCDGGLGYFIRFNHNGEVRRASREVHGIDAFLLHGRDASLFPASFLSMGQPWWDYWIPLVFADNHRPVRAIDFPVAFHHNHPQNWSWSNWGRCGIEFGRVTALAGNGGFEPSGPTAWRTRCEIQHHTTPVSRQPFNIRQWVQQKFSGPEAKLFLELGARDSSTAAWLAQLPNVTIQLVEPDPRNQPQPQRNVVVHRKAIGDHNGKTSLLLSRHGWGHPWTHSSTIKQPFNHLLRYPVTFGESLQVELQTLDSLYEEQRLGIVDFLWADIEGAEGDMIRGGRLTLARTRYLFTEFSDDELYKDQITLSEILAMLPQFKVIEMWEDYVLLENQMLKDH